MSYSRFLTTSVPNYRLALMLSNTLWYRFIAATIRSCSFSGGMVKTLAKMSSLEIPGITPLASFLISSMTVIKHI